MCFYVNELLGTPPVTPHLHQNGFNNGGTNMNTAGPPPAAAAAANSNQQPLTGAGQAYTGAQGTWKGSNTLTYTQSMQPPDNRNHCTPYCKITPL